MRIIGSLNNQKHAKRLSAYLRSKGIENTCEIAFDKAQDHITCSVWVHEEDQVDEAYKHFQAFEKDPDNEQYKTSAEHNKKPFSAIENPNQIKIEDKPKGPKSSLFGMTYLLMGLCVMVYFLNLMQETSIAKKTEGRTIVLFTPIQYALLYDVPPSLLKINELLQKHPIPRNAKAEDIPEVVKKEIKIIENMPYFRGFYEALVAKVSKKAAKPTGPMFIKLKEGQVWRLITPVILHKDLIHILFNMLWLWFLGKQIEIRVPAIRMLLMVLIIGIISNTSQYLMSGPYFLGFSGVVMGMAGFIWMRQRIAPWEGYPIQKSTFLFLAIFVLAMMGIQIVSFVMEASGKEFMFNIANTAHVSGGIIGAILGRFSFFAWRSS